MRGLRMGAASEHSGTVSILLQIWMRILMTHWTLQIVQSERRCYCNDVSCVTTGYMCKSSLGVCFSQTTHDGATRTRFYHACAEMLPENQAGACTDGGGIEVGSKVTARSEDGLLDKRMQIVCCVTDMCNYREGRRSDGDQLRPPSNSISHNNPQNGEGGHFVHPSSVDHQRASEDRHIWFQALVIAVSLIGTVVLLFLLLVTVKVLVLDQRRRVPPVSRSSTSGDVIEGANLPDERCWRHDTGPEIDNSYCCCEDDGEEGRKEERTEGINDRLMGRGKLGGDVGGKVFPVSYQCVAFSAGQNAFRTDLVPYHHHHAYLLHQHHCHHYSHHHNLHHHSLFCPQEKCRCFSDDNQTTETKPQKT